MAESRQPLHVFGGLGQVAAAQGDGGEDRHRERVAGEAPAGLHPPRGRFGQRGRIVEPARRQGDPGAQHLGYPFRPRAPHLEGISDRGGFVEPADLDEAEARNM